MNTLFSKEPNYQFHFYSFRFLNPYSNDQSYLRVSKIGKKMVKLEAWLEKIIDSFAKFFYTIVSMYVSHCLNLPLTTVKMLLVWRKGSYSEIPSLLSSKFPVGGVIILLLRIEKLKSNWENSYICSNVCAFILKSRFVFQCY